MRYDRITALVTDAEVDEAALLTAAAIAARQDAPLAVRCLAFDPAGHDIGAAVGPGDGALGESRARARDRAGTLQDWATGLLQGGPARSEATAEVLPTMGLKDEIARLTALAGLVVATTPHGEVRLPVQAALFEAALVGSPAPVLAVPETGTTPQGSFERILIAFDESDACLAAIRGALPLLGAAQRVDVVSVEANRPTPARAEPSGAAAALLERNEVAAEWTVIPLDAPRLFDCLARFAQEHGAGLIVMGAYGHSRLREALLGGTTRDALHDTRLPLLMAH